MYTVRITNHNAKTRFGHAVHHRPGLCFSCGSDHKPLKTRNDENTGWYLDWPKICVCGSRIGCWMILRSYTQGSARCYELDPALPERYRTRKDAVKAKKEKNL